MTALWAIVLDTWKQSRQQAVFVVMLVILAVTAVATIVVPSSFEQPDGTDRIGFIWDDEPAPVLEQAWTGIYAQTLMLQGDAPIDPFDSGSAQEQSEAMEAAMRAAEAEADTPYAQRSVEVILFAVASAVFSLSMILFLAASSGYVPAMLEAGAIDVVLARPIDRLRIYLGKYLGGLALYSAAIAVTYLLIYVGLGLRTGVWASRVFLVMPLQIFSAAVLFVIIAALGVVSRSSTLCLVVGLLFYLVVDSIVGTLIQMQRMQLFTDIGWLDGLVQAMRATLPNFGLLKENATASVLNIPLMEWQPFAVAFAWLLLALGFGYWRFAKTDY